jgi:hypothetical protein
MQYAQLADLDLQLLTFSETEKQKSEGKPYDCRSVAGAFLKIDAGKCYLAFNENAPADAEYMAGVMSHEVAHVYRAFHGLVTSSPEEEEYLTDVTAVYLGFGILATNVNFRSRTYGTNVGYRGTFSWSTTKVGYLTPQAFAYLLALQFAARGLSPGEYRHLLKQLEPDQAAFTKAAISSIHDWSEEVPGLLGLPHRKFWSLPKSLSQILQPLPEWQIVKTRRPVFSILKSHMGLFGVSGLIAGFILGVLLTATLEIDIFLLLPVIGLAAGVYWGYRQRYYVCSNPECGNFLPPDAAICPNCEGPIFDPSQTQARKAGP